MYKKEHWRNDGVTAATTENRDLPPNCVFFAISCWIKHFWIIWDKLKNKIPYFCIFTCDILNILLLKQKFISGNWIFFKISWSQIIMINLIRRDITNKHIRRHMAVLSGGGVSTAVSSQFLIVHHQSDKFHCCNSFFGRVPALVLKSGTSEFPLFSI